MNRTKLLLIIVLSGLLGITLLATLSFNSDSASNAAISSTVHNSQRDPNAAPENSALTAQENSTLIIESQPAITRQQITSAGGNFTVPEGLPFLRVWVSNQGSTLLTVDIRKSNSPKSYILYQVPPGEQLVIPNQGKATGTGDHTIHFSGKDGTVAGEYSIDMFSSSEKSQE